MDMKKVLAGLVEALVARAAAGRPDTLAEDYRLTFT
jgi:hypothetical protein